MADLLAGRYEFIRRLGEGQGAMAEVYLADDTKLLRKVAVKLLPRHFLQDPDFRRRFQKEAETWAKLEHDNIVRLYDYDPDADQPYMVMHYIKGESLLGHLQNQGALSLPETLDLIRPICSALDSIHKQGIVHRDLKPANILLDKEKRAYLTDFGIAKPIEGTAALTGSILVGTPGYMSPEQWRGEKELDGRSDQYSLAMVLFEMLSGQLPFNTDTLHGMMHFHLYETAPAIRSLRPDLPKGVEEALKRALNKKLEQRFSGQTVRTHSEAIASGVQELFAALQTAADGKKTAAAKPTRLLRERPSAPEGILKRRKGPLAWVYAGIGILVVALIWVATQLPTVGALEPTATAAPTPFLQIDQVRIASLLFVRPSHTGNVVSVAFSPDGSQIASSGRDGLIVIGPVTARGAIRELKDNSNSINDVAFSPDGSLLASGSEDHTVRIWDTVSGEIVKTLTGHTEAVLTVAFAPDGTVLASSGIDGTVRLWRVADGELLHTLTGHTTLVNAITYNPRNNTLASGDMFGNVLIWSISDGELLRTLNPGIVDALTFSPDGLLLAGSSGNTVRIVDSSTGFLVGTLIGHQDFVHSLAFSPDNRLVATGSADNTIGIWRVGDEQLLQTVAGHTDTVSSVAFSPDGLFLASGSDDLTVRIWEIDSTGE